MALSGWSEARIRRGHRVRGNLVLVLLIPVFALLAGRLYYLQVLSGPALSGRADLQSHLRVELPAVPGSLLDARGRPLAVSLPAYTVAGDIPNIESAGAVADELARVLDARREDVLRRLRREHVRLVTLARNLAPERAAHVRALGLAGIRVNEQEASETRRRRGGPAAAPRATVTADLRRVRDRARTAAELAPRLGMTEDAVAARLRAEHVRFVYLVRQVEADRAERVRALDLRGIHLVPESKRFYPNGNVGCHAIGFAGLDGGLEGLERALWTDLDGRPGEVRKRCDARRRAVREVFRREPEHGRNAVLTLDLAIQEIVERELDRIVETHHPRGVSVVVMDPRTGAILALGSRPTFDPNAFGSSSTLERRCRPLVDVYEPGSIFKPFIAAAAIDAGAVRLGQKLFCENGAWRVGYRTIRSVHAHGWIPIEMVLIKSDNIGAAKIGQRLGPELACRYLRGFGFGERPGTGFPGEENGILRPLARWQRDSVLSIAFGQEVGATTLQIASGYCALVNGGVLYQPRLVAELREPDGRIARRFPPHAVARVIRPETSAWVRKTLRRAVTEGTGRRAKMREYPSGGKTGTAQKVVDGTYSHDKFIGSFAGFAPADAPRLVVVVSVDEPQGAYYGGTVAAPAAREILRDGLKYMGVPAAPPRMAHTSRRRP